MAKVWKLPPLPPKIVIKPPTVDIEVKGSTPDVYFRSTGAKSLISNLLGLPQVALDAAGVEMAMIAHEVIVDAQENYVPVDLGDLKASGDSDSYVPGSSTTAAEIAMWFGAEDSNETLASLAAHGLTKKNVSLYALDQHENLTYHHPPMDHKTGHGGKIGGSGPGTGTGGPKYLEKPLTVMEPNVAPRIALAIRLAFMGTSEATAATITGA